MFEWTVLIVEARVEAEDSLKGKEGAGGSGKSSKEGNEKRITLGFHLEPPDTQ